MKFFNRMHYGENAAENGEPRGKKRGFFRAALFFAFTFLFFAPFLSTGKSIAASADTGPKPSVRITFENMDDAL
ncbi:MAG: hypothetical protein ACI4SH_08355, partial [Candidatus Scatosoma sp.]